MEHGFRIIDYGKLLYPQYCNSESFPSLSDLLANDDIRNTLKNAAKKELEDNEVSFHPAVLNHLQKLAED